MDFEQELNDMMEISEFFTNYRDMLKGDSLDADIHNVISIIVTRERMVGNLQVNHNHSFSDDVYLVFAYNELDDDIADFMLSSYEWD